MRPMSQTGVENEVVVGDLNSNKVGSGARKNAGKDPLDLIPVEHWLFLWTPRLERGGHDDLTHMLISLADWQYGHNESIWDALLAMETSWKDSAWTFDFGAKKYARWNWAKGMDFMVPVGCILRHCRAILEWGEEIDQDSQTTHKGCITCNLHMLAYYTDRYPQLDTRPKIEE